MTDDDKRLDVFGSIDIDKIQEEIRRDLEKTESIHNTADVSHHPEESDIIDIPVYSGASLSEETPAPPEIFSTHNEWLKADIEDDRDMSDGVTGGFYRETIKNAKEKRNTGKWIKKAVAIFLAVTIGMGSLGFGIGAGFGYFNRSEAAQTPDTYDDSAGVTLTSVGYTFENIVEETEVGTLADIVEFLKPSVVGITSHVEFGQFSDIRNGSGLIFAENDERIFIVTNYYVVQGGGNQFAVSISGSEPLIGRPAGVDNTANVAVLSVEKSQLIAAGIDTIVIATFGDSDQMRVGDTVLAIGNAMGYGNAVTRGVISSAEQTVVLPAGGHTLPLLQTDAAINYGNSGGPLINTRGEVIGINFDRASSMIFGMTNVEGMGFSISSNIIAPILDDLVNGRRPALGIRGGTITEENATRLGIPAIGVYVSEVMPGRAADRGGMMDSDVITGFNGMHVFNWQDLVYAIRSSRIGEEVEVRVLRYGTTAITLYLELDVMIVDNF